MMTGPLQSLRLVRSKGWLRVIGSETTYNYVLGVNGLGITMLGSLNEQRHRPGRYRCKGVPVERHALEQNPSKMPRDELQKCRAP